MEIKNTFVGGRMSKDVNERLVTPDLYNNAENIRILNSVSGDAGVVSNVLGNTKLTNFNLTNGKTIGAFADNSNSKLYFFVTSDTKDMVVEYDDNMKSTNILLEASKPNTSLNFDTAYPITGVVKVINGNPEKDLLTWTDNLNSIKIINIKRAKSYAVDGFTEEDISLIKAPPSYPPTTVMSSRNRGTNDLADKYIAFSYRYKYKDGFVSALAPFTEYQFTPAAGFDHNYDTNENSNMTNLYDTIEVSFLTGDENVEGIDVVFKQSGSNNVNLIRSFDKAKSDFNDNTTQSLYLSTVQGYTVLPEDELFRVFDNVPIRAKALDLIGSRLCFGNYVEGYDMVTADGTTTYAAITTVLLSAAPTSYNVNSVKTLRWYDPGIVYVDKSGRRSTVQTSSFADDQWNSIYVGASNSDKQNKLQISIHNPAPYWADRYQIVIRERTEDYHNIFIDGTKVYEDGTYRYCMLEAENKNKVQEGDILYVKIDTNGRVTSKVEAPVLEIATKEQDFITGALPGLYMKLQPSGYTLDRNAVAGDVAVFETKPLESNLNIYYETGDMYPIINGYHQGNVQNQSTINNSAIVTSKFFNCFTMGSGVESIRYLDRFTGNLLKNDLIPNSTSSDVYQEIRRFCDLTYSEVYNENTNLNGLNEFNLSKGNFKEDIDKKYGSIQKLFSRDSDLMVFQEDKISKVLYGKNLLMNADGSSNVSAMDEVLGQQIMYSGEYGISKEPESFAVFGNRVYNTDTKRGVVLRTSIDGITEIVTGMKNYFRDLFIETEGTNKYGAYDPYNDQYVLSVDSEKVIETTTLEIDGSYELSNYSGTLPLTIDLGNSQGRFYFNTSSNGKPVRYVTVFNGVTTDSGYIGDAQYNDELDALGLPDVVGSSYSYTSALKETENLCNASVTVYAPLCGTNFRISDIRFNHTTIYIGTIVLGDSGDVSQYATLSVEYIHNIYSGSARLTPVTFTNSYPVMWFGDIGSIGTDHYPAPNSVITVRTISKTADALFTSSNKIGYYFSSTSLSNWESAISLATYPAENSTVSGDETITYITFNYGATRYGYLYLVWDFRDAFENTVLTTTLQKNDCVAPAVGSFVTYTVPAGEYTSLVSQADADAQATADATANAQTYANSNGTCIPPDGEGSTLVMSSSVPDGNGLGTLDFIGGEDSEDISLNFSYWYTTVGYIDFEGDITVAPIDSLHRNINGTVHLDENGEAHINYEITLGSKCTVTLTNRSSAEPDPVIVTTIIDNL